MTRGWLPKVDRQSEMPQRTTISHIKLGAVCGHIRRKPLPKKPAKNIGSLRLKISYMYPAIADQIKPHIIEIKSMSDVIRP